MWRAASACRGGFAENHASGHVNDLSPARSHEFMWKPWGDASPFHTARKPTVKHGGRGTLCTAGILTDSSDIAHCMTVECRYGLPEVGSIFNALGLAVARMRLPLIERLSPASQRTDLGTGP